jgi:hypothetical protein
MDWMYKEHDSNGESSPDMNKQSSPCNSLTKLEDKNFTVVNETEDSVDHFEEKMSAQTTLLENEEGDSVDSSTIVGPITSDFDELAAKSMDSKQPGGDKDVNKLFCDSRDILSPQSGLGETMNMNSGLPIDGLEKMAEEVCGDQSNKDKAIKSLRQEVRVYTKDNFSAWLSMSAFV